MLSCSAQHHDNYGIAYELTEAMASPRTAELAGAAVEVRIQVNALQVDVPGRFFTDSGDGVRRRRSGTLSSSQLAHRADV